MHEYLWNTHVVTEPRMEFVALTSPFSSAFLQSFQQSRSEPPVHEVVGEAAKILREFHVGAQFDVTKSAKVLEIVSRKSADPPPKPLGKELLEVLFKVASWPVILEAGSLVHQRDDPDVRQTAY